MRPTPIADPHGPNGLRPGYRWNYARCPGLGTDDLMRAPYGPARGLVPMPWRLSAGRTKPPVCRDGIGTTQARSFASKRAQESYALRVELGDRAYAELTGARIGRRTVAKAPRPANPAVEVVRRKADGGRAVVLSDHELMSVLGIKPIGYLD